ncbi:MAG: TolC family protein [Bacteroidetes bacterium]|jgi:outer membrane protein|nr:TolC family protein [Bacteroidota bacterium]
MRFSKYILTLLFITGTIWANAQVADTSFTLQKCLDIAIKNNLQVKQSNANAELARVDYRQAIENLLPNISGSASRSFNSGRAISPLTNSYVNQSATNDNYGLTGSMTLFNGFSLINAIKATSLAFQAGKMNFQAAKDAVTVNVITSYLAILDDQEILTASKSQLAYQKETVDRLTILEKQGANKAASDLTDQQGQLAANEVSVVNSQNALDAAKLTLFQIMNIPYQAGVKFEDVNAENLRGDYGSDPDQVYQTALQRFAAVKAATLSREAAQKNVSSLRGQLAPSITLGGGLNTAYSNTAQQSVFIDSTTSAVKGLYAQGPAGKETIFATNANTASQDISYRDQLKNNYSSYVSIGINIPIFLNGTRRNALSRAKINALYARDVEENAKIVLKQNVEQAYLNMMAAYKKYQVLMDQVKAYTESFRIYKLRFDAGVLTSVDYIFAKNNLDAATVNMISAKYDYFITSKILDYYQGKLTWQ